MPTTPNRRTLLTRVEPALDAQVEDLRRVYRREDDPNILTKNDLLELLIRSGLRAEARRKAKSVTEDTA